MKITAKDVAILRRETGAGMMDCKKALEASGGDIELAKDNLRKNGQKLSAKRADRETNEGVVIALASNDSKKGIAINLSCETDFVAKNDDFVNFAKKIADIALNKFPSSKDDLLGLEYESGLTVGEKVTEQVGVIGEKVEISSYEWLEAPSVVPYIHAGYKRGVLIGLNKEGDNQEVGKNVAMQVAAMNPIAVDKDGIDATVIQREIEIGMEQARNEGKPDNLLERIAQGKLGKFYKENTLLNQEYVKGSNKETVSAYLKGVDNDLTVTAFRHVALGS